MRLGASVHSASPVAAERPQLLYLGSRETSVCLLRRISSVVGRGADQSCGMVFEVGDESVSSEMGENVRLYGVPRSHGLDSCVCHDYEMK